MDHARVLKNLRSNSSKSWEDCVQILILDSEVKIHKQEILQKEQGPGNQNIQYGIC